VTVFTCYRVIIITLMYGVDYVNGGEMFTHLYQRERFSEREVRIYIAEIVVALERLHSVRFVMFCY